MLVAKPDYKPDGLRWSSCSNNIRISLINSPTWAYTKLVWPDNGGVVQPSRIVRPY